MCHRKRSSNKSSRSESTRPVLEKTDDLLAALSDVPIQPIRMNPPPYFASSDQVLCHQCHYHQSRIVDLLSQYSYSENSSCSDEEEESDEEKRRKWLSGAEKYRQKLEQRYALCETCQWRVQQRLQQVKDWTRAVKVAQLRKDADEKRRSKWKWQWSIVFAVLLNIAAETVACYVFIQNWILPIEWIIGFCCILFILESCFTLPNFISLIRIISLGWMLSHFDWTDESIWGARLVLVLISFRFLKRRMMKRREIPKVTMPVEPPVKTFRKRTTATEQVDWRLDPSNTLAMQRRRKNPFEPASSFPTTLSSWQPTPSPLLPVKNTSTYTPAPFSSYAKMGTQASLHQPGTVATWRIESARHLSRPPLLDTPVQLAAQRQTAMQLANEQRQQFLSHDWQITPSVFDAPSSGLEASLSAVRIGDKSKK